MVVLIHELFHGLYVMRNCSQESPLLLLQFNQQRRMPDPNPASTTSVPNADLPELKYFPIRGKAEPIRLMLEDIGMVFPPCHHEPGV